jgi:hypothetical protein
MAPIEECNQEHEKTLKNKSNQKSTKNIYKKKHDQRHKEHQQKNMTKVTKTLIENITDKTT